MSAPERVQQLVETFSNNIDAYKKGAYNETQVRREFIDPFFESLGWDVANKNGYAEAYKDVIHEDAIKVGGVTKAPDYCFRIGGARKFFLEAKKPSVNIAEDIHPAYQLRRYGWSAKLPLSILTDFEELAVYDCRVKPNKADKVSHSRILYLTFTDYIDRWDEISGIFSRDAILKGSFDKYIESAKIKKGTTEVDAAFLQEIERWRELLARNIALRNSALSQRELNFAVQRTIDRIVFLRICEDRGMETYGSLMALKNGENVYRRLFQLLKKADDKYNSGLFHFKKEKDREICDTLTPVLNIDDKPLKDIFKNLYYPESPYEFSVLPADILGQVYEKFLGKVIRLTSGHQAKIEEKPEVRKAGGVYYTPDYIVGYIVKNTVGRLVEGKKPGPRGGVSNLKILDPACGSGSFLIGAYQFLLDWHRDAYVADDPKKWAKGKTPRLYQSQRGEWRLTTDERKRILLNNIYGVDIDPQAVEVTKLSLLLKVLEGEDEQSIGKQMSLFQERVLPDLSKNIKCGNSLIKPDFYENNQMNILNEEELYRINTFDWDVEFQEIMNDDGFDVVIGNPPYINALTLSKIQGPEIKEYWKKVYSTARGTYDIYVLFFEKALNIVKKNGFVSFITPNKFLSSPYGKELRQWIYDNHSIKEIVDYSDTKVFGKIAVYPIITIFESTKSFPQQITVLKAKGENSVDFYKENIKTKHINKIPENIWGSFLTHNLGLMTKIYSNTKPLKEVADVQATSTASESDEYSNHIYEKGEFDSGMKIINTGTIDPYMTKYGIEPLTNKRKKYICPVIDISRVKPNRAEQYNTPKIIFAKMAKRIEAFLDSSGEFASINTNCVYNPINNLSLEYLNALFNSKIMTFVYSNMFSALKMSGGYFQFQAPQLRLLPIVTSSPKEMQLVSDLSNQMQVLNKKFIESKMAPQKDILKRQINTTDQQIDQLVYELYDLTPEEIAIVEDNRV